MQLSEAASAAQDKLAFFRTRLSAGTSLLLLLLRLRFALSAEHSSVLEAHLSPIIDETGDMGWEERTDVAITHLLKTALSKDRDAVKEGRSSAPSNLSRPADAAKLKKHITLVADRLHKGIRPIQDAAPAPPRPADGAGAEGLSMSGL